MENSNFNACFSCFKFKQVSEFVILGNKKDSKELYELQHYYITTFEYFEKAIVSRTNCYYFITFVKFSIIV